MDEVNNQINETGNDKPNTCSVNCKIRSCTAPVRYISILKTLTIVKQRFCSERCSNYMYEGLSLTTKFHFKDFAGPVRGVNDNDFWRREVAAKFGNRSSH